MGPQPEPQATSIGAGELSNVQSAVEHRDVEMGAVEKPEAVAPSFSKLPSKVALSLPAECFNGHTLKLNWFWRPEMLLAALVYHFGMNNAAWILWFNGRIGDVIGVCLFTLIPGLANNVLPGFIFGCSKWVLLAMICFEMSCAAGSNVILGTSLIGLCSSYVLEVLVVSGIVCCGMMERRRCKYFIVIRLWVLLTQLGPMLLLRFNTIFDLLPDFASGMAFPVISTVYSAVGVVSIRMVNRSMMFPGVPVTGCSSALYMVIAVAQGLIVVGFLPRAELIFGDAKVSRIFTTLAGTALVSVGSELTNRCFLVQRLKHWTSTKLGAAPAPLVIEPEMDAQFRSSFVLNQSVLPQLLMIIVCALPGGAQFASNPWVWVALPLKAGCSFLCDAIILLVHRQNHGIEGESLWGTYTRLREPFQNWPHLQCDGGRHFEEAKKKAAGQAADEVVSDERAKALMEVKWSQHWYLTDARLIAFVCAFIPMVGMTSGMFMRYGPCGFQTSLMAVRCGGIYTPEDFGL
jgi:hypothetical protein